MKIFRKGTIEMKAKILFTQSKAFKNHSLQTLVAKGSEKTRKNCNQLDTLCPSYRVSTDKNTLLHSLDVFGGKYSVKIAKNFNQKDKDK